MQKEELLNIILKLYLNLGFEPNFSRISKYYLSHL
jgi:hypothetical protein